METNEKKTYRIDIDGNVIHHRMNHDGTATLYCRGEVFKAVMPEMVDKLPGYFNVLTDPDDDGPMMVIVDPNKVSLNISLGVGMFGFQIAEPCEEDCEKCEQRDTCESSLAKKEDDPDE